MSLTKTIIWDDVSSALIPELVIGQVTRDLIGLPRGSFKEVPGREGSWFFRQSRGRREIRAVCHLEAATTATRRDVIESLAEWLDVESEAKLQISDEPGIYYEAVLIEAPRPDEWREFATFELAWSAQPYSLDNDLSTESFASGVNTTHLWNPTLSVFCYPVIEITPTNGTLTGFNLTTNGDILTWSGSLADDATLTINSIAGVVLTGSNGDIELTGAYDPNLADMEGVSGTFPTLYPGGNNTITFFKVGGTATAITVTITYRKRYRR